MANVRAQKELFCSSGYAPERRELDWLGLPPIVRVLLATDGTVTKSLESYFWEPVAVRCKSQSALTLLEHNRELQANSVWCRQDELWRRDVDLVGKHSAKCYVQASSVVCFSLLPKALRDGLVEGGLGIGGVIRELGLETYRRVVAIGQQPSLPLAPEKVWRVYHLYYRERVLMQITEKFDLNAFT